MPLLQKCAREDFDSHGVLLGPDEMRHRRAVHPYYDVGKSDGADRVGGRGRSPVAASAELGAAAPEGPLEGGIVSERAVRVVA